METHALFYEFRVGSILWLEEEFEGRFKYFEDGIRRRASAVDV
jgi:hypothetical protein